MNPFLNDILIKILIILLAVLTVLLVIGVAGLGIYALNYLLPKPIF